MNNKRIPDFNTLLKQGDIEHSKHRTPEARIIDRVLARVPVNRKALQIYDIMHLFIPIDGDERDVQLYSHSQGDWEILKYQKGQVWTIPTSIISGKINQRHGYDTIANPPQTPYDLWQWATGMGYMPCELL